MLSKNENGCPRGQFDRKKWVVRCQGRMPRGYFLLQKLGHPLHSGMSASTTTSLNWTRRAYEGMTMFVQRLPAILRKMLGPDARLPRTIFTDRGTGMYSSQGRVVKAYGAAVKAAGFKLFWGDDASQQSPDMPDLLLHETAVAWFRKKMRKQRPVCAPWEETHAQWIARARLVVAHVNANHRVDKLCQQFPQRLQACKDSAGERLRK